MSAIAIGGDGADADALGAQASGVAAIALGADADARADNSIAFGAGAVAVQAGAIAFGAGADAQRTNSLALGTNAAAGEFSAAFGENATATQAGGVAFGTSANAGFLSTSIGRVAISRDNAVAIGFSSFAENNAVAVGDDSTASGDSSVALGRQAMATQAGSTAIGAGAATTAANQVTLGGTGSSVRIGDIDASTAAQLGPVDAVTVDANGTLGRQSVATAASVDNVRVALNAVAQVSTAQFDALSGRVQAIDFQLDQLDDDVRSGVAAAMALTDAPMPSQPGKTSYIGKGATFRGEFGFSLGLTQRLNSDQPFAISASVSHAGGNNTGASVAFSGEF